MTRVFVLWDDSHLWGLLVLRYLRALGVPHGVLRAIDIAEGALSGKSMALGPSPKHDALLIAPGGWARGRARRLGPVGLAAVRDFVAGGGAYLGFCGGAGLALSGPNPAEGLGLCPWGRMGFSGRLQHLLSGDVRLRVEAENAPGGGRDLLAQVWWPSQFAPADDDSGVEVLARYDGPGPDFWVADLALASLPEEALADWQNLYGLTVRPGFLAGRPAVIAGTYGKGRYLLSYPHLETPDSPDGNRWLARIVADMGGVVPPAAALGADFVTPPWRVGAEGVRWDDATLLKAKAELEEVVALGQEHLLLFWRNPWLLGWRRGVPGPGLNSLYALVCEALSHPPDEATLSWWREVADEFAGLSKLLCKGLSGLLLAERLDMTVRQTPGVDGADDVFTKNLREMRAALFGPPPAAGGVCGQLLHMLEELCARLWGGT